MRAPSDRKTSLGDAAKELGRRVHSKMGQCPNLFKKATLKRADFTSYYYGAHFCIHPSRVKGHWLSLWLSICRPLTPPKGLEVDTLIHELLVSAESLEFGAALQLMSRTGIQRASHNMQQYSSNYCCLPISCSILWNWKDSVGQTWKPHQPTP